jgi:hypothetical protein
MMLTGPQEVEILGEVENSFSFPSKDLEISQMSKTMDYRGVMTEYRGYSLLEIIQAAKPSPQANTVLLEASDGYAFLFSFEELQNNPNILLVQNGKGNKASFDIVGPVSSKAWVKNLTKITISASEGLTIINSNGETHTFDPDQWLDEMDSTRVNLSQGSQKLQGVPLWKIVEYYQSDCSYQEVNLKSGKSTETLTWEELNANDDLRLFTVINEQGISFVLAEMSGDVLLEEISGVEISK